MLVYDGPDKCGLPVDPTGKEPVMAGVAGCDVAGEGESTTHIRCDLVATILATVCARVE